ncbi:hypothetical protein B5X24_HaOG216435 [Helicoverpa armigera]|nr:hypothetical protein B5X24_HaOG216435 [Helicoverpa armigera]
MYDHRLKMVRAPRKPQFSTDHVSSEPKRFKPSTIVCHYCGIAGHRAINCRKKADKTKHPGPAKSSLAKNVVCYRCGEAGHVAPRCPKTTGKRPGGSSESAVSEASSSHSSKKRVEACEVRPTTSVLRHSEQKRVDITTLSDNWCCDNINRFPIAFACDNPVSLSCFEWKEPLLVRRCGVRERDATPGFYCCPVCSVNYISRDAVFACVQRHYEKHE